MASAQSRWEGDLFVNGTFTPKAMNLPANSVNDAQVGGSAGVAASKLQHQYEPTYRQPSANNAAAEAQVLHRVAGSTGLIVDFRVGAVVAGTGTASVVVDLWKNGVSILTATITLTGSTAAYATVQPAGYTSTALVAGDVLEVKVTSPSAGTGALAKGLFAQLVIREDAQ